MLEAVAPFELEKLGSDTALPIDRLSELEDKLGVLIEVQDADGSPVVQPATPVPVPATVPTENEAALRSGMTVAQAASILGLSIQRLFDLLPPPYQATTELKESDLQRLSPLGVVTKQRDRPTPMITPPSVVRTTAPTAVPAALPAAGIWRTSLAEQLWQFEQQPVFTRERTMIAKYVLFLAELIRLKPSASEILLNYRPRTRAYFARSSAEILSESPYASVHQLRHGGLFAMGTLQDSSKFTVIRRVLGDCGLPPEDIRRLLGGF